MTLSPVPTGPLVDPSSGAFTPLPISSTRLNAGFWKTRQDLNHDAIIPHALKWEKRIGWIDNFVHAAAGDIADHFKGLWFADSDVYKLLEAMTWEAARSGDADMDAEVDRIAHLIEAIQLPDGYVDSRYGHPGQPDRYTDFEMGHELYCFGHLFQAAVARIRTGHDSEDTLVRVALKVAHHVVETFGEGGLEKVGGHPEVEVGLVELARATGDPRLSDQAMIFLDRRGHQLLADNLWEFSSEYFQDDIPVRDATILRGHAVRALYLCAGAIDAAVEKGDAELLAAAKLQYDNTLARRTYITGGMGSHHKDEAFGADFELPADRSYCESCAGIASVMCAWRLLLATGDMSYGDIIERTLFNMLATSFQDDGQAFFYANTLHQRTPAQEMPADELCMRALSQLRAPWFEVSCCPTNISRTLATLSGLVASTCGREVQIHQYAPSRISAEVEGSPFVLDIEGNYPFEGTLRVSVVEAPMGEASLAFRIPAWAVGASIAGEEAHPGVHRISRVFRAGESFEVIFPMLPRLTTADDRVDAVRGCVAVERGPLVLCVESVDLPGDLSVNDVRVVSGAQPVVDDRGEVRISARPVTYADSSFAYSASASRSHGGGSEFDMLLSPYYHWGNRGESTMRVWLPVEVK